MNQNMLGTIHHVLAKLGMGFGSDHRTIGLSFSDANLTQQVYLQYFNAHSAISQGLNLQLICLSTNANIPLQSLIGQTATVEQMTDHGIPAHTSGIITQAVKGSSDGGFTVYKLSLQDSFSGLMPKRRNSRVFMQKSVLDITRILFDEWQQKAPLFANSIGLDHNLVKQNADVRPFTMQHQESDFDFLTRLWRSTGINWFIDQTSSQPSAQQLSHQHRIVLFDDNKLLAPLAPPTLYFQRSDATQQQDSITQLLSNQQLHSSHVHIQRWSQQHGNMDEQANISSARQSEAYTSATLNLEQAWHIDAAALGDLNGQDQNTQPSQQQLARLGELLIKRQELDSKSATAIGTVRHAKVGYWFKLAAPTQSKLSNIKSNEFLITQLSCDAYNNLPKEISTQILALIEQSQWPLPEIQKQQQPATQSYQVSQRHQVKMTLVDRDVAIVPFYDPQLHVAKAHPMRARVVSANGDTIHVDAWGRIKVQFLFSRAEDNTHSGGAGSNDSDSDSAWIDVLTPWAGDGEASYGTRFLPRVGEMVVVDFFDGNADHPFVLGRIHEGNRTPTQFDGLGALPDTRALSGIKSQEIGGQGFNQLRLDDTTGQVNAQLASSHAVSQLNMGNLVDPRKTEEGKPRGAGFELRTDQFGALRAGQGLLLSSYEQTQAKADHLQAAQAKSQLEGSVSQASALSEVAKNQQTDPLNGLDGLKSFIEHIEQRDEDKATSFKQALMLLASVDSIGLSSQQDIHVSSDGQLNQTAGDSINLSSQKNIIAQASQKISLFAAGKGIQTIAAKGKLAIQAQGDGIEAIARKVIQFISTEDRIEITSPKEIVINASGSQLKINSGGVFTTTGAKFEAKAGQHVFGGGRKVINDIPFLPTPSNGGYILEFDVRHKISNELLESAPTFSLIDSKGNVRTGDVPKDGIVRITSNDKEEKYTIMVHKYDADVSEQEE